MKLNRKLNAASMAALAALTLSVPALAQDKPVEQKPTPTPTATMPAPAPEPGSEIVVNEKDGLVKAVETATKTLAEGKLKEVTIKITTCDDQTLPPMIDAKGKINIVGCGAETPAGPNTDYKAKRTVLVLGEKEMESGVVVKSPLSVSGVSARVKGTLFEVHSSFWLKNSVFLNQRVEGQKLRVSRTIKGMIPDGKVSAEIMIQDTSFYHVAVLSGATSGAKVTVKNSLLHEIPEKDRFILSLEPGTGEVGPALVEGCEFDGHFVKDGAASFYISRPNVIVRNNFFYLDAPSDDGGGIRLMSPEKGLPLKGIEITGNQFIGNVAIDNPMGLPLEKEAVVIKGNDFSKAEEVLPTKEKNKELGTISPKEAFMAQENFWGMLKTAEVMADTSKELKEIPKVPIMRLVSQFDGETRFETATNIARRLYRQGAETVILARADDVSDSVSAVPLAEEMKAPILLTQPNELHEAVAKEIKRLQPNGGKVILMGGEVALSKAVEEAVVKNGGKVERVAGANRAATAVETAKKLKGMDKAKEFVLVDGADWQPDLIAGPVAAEVDGATLLTNGDQMAPETAAFLKEHAAVKVTAIGDKAIKTGAAKEMVAGMEPTDLSLAVAKKFFKDTKVVGMATTVDFADALAGGRHIAEKDGPLLLVPPTVPASISEYLKTNSQIGYVNVYGGEKRFSEKVIEALSK